MATIFLVVGSVYGAAEYVAEQLEGPLKERGHKVQYVDQFDAFADIGDGPLLVITSTTGSGDLPDNIVPLFQDLKDRFPLMPALRYGVIALGDSSYGDTYCGGGRQFDELLTELQAKRIVDRLEIDACEVAEPEVEALKWLPTWLEQLSAPDSNVA